MPEEIERKIYNVLEDMYRFCKPPKEALEQIKEIISKEVKYNEKS